MFLEVRIFATKRTKKGFINSTGWKFKPKKANHLFAPFTSMPIIGTKKSVRKKIKKIINEVLFIKLTFKNEIKTITEKEKDA